MHSTKKRDLTKLTPAQRTALILRVNKNTHTAVRTREQIEANGKNIGTIAGMSVYGDTNQVDPRKYHVHKG